MTWTSAVAGLALATAGVLAGCNTYYDPGDDYVRALRFYDRGDHATARTIWDRLAKAGDCDAEARLGMMDYMESPDSMDRVAAFRMIQDAAERGQPLAMILNGSLHLHGGLASPDSQTIPCSHCRIETDPVVAAKWLLLGKKHAAYSGQTRMADFYLAQAKAKLSAEQNARAEQSAAAWSPRGPECKPRSLW